MTLRNALHSSTERRPHLSQHYYYTGQFARKASVTVRTLRYYDKVGLLKPSHFTASGYRLYTDADLLRLQRILALKFLGFTLDEIRQCLRIGPAALPESLALQKAMMCERRAQLDNVIKHGDESIQNSLNRMWQAAFNDSQPFPFARPYSREEMEFIVEAIKLHRQARG